VPDVWIGRALVVLVAAAPCAFAISVPVTVLASIAAATRSGILIKGGAAIERLATVRTVAFDKTGTLTRNRPTVVEVVTIGGATRDEVVGFAAAVEALSEHPLAAAIVAATDRRPRDATDVRTVAGMGVTGVVDARPVRLGKPGFIRPATIGVDIVRLQSSGASVVLVERDGETIGAIAVRDEVRPEAGSVVAALHSGGTERVVMLTGDNELTARVVADWIGIEDVRADLLPDDKLAAIHELQARGPVAMVGDGINDAPALATADVGIAMGAAGSDIAIEAADVAIMGDSLDHLPALLAHARRTRRIMIQNLVMSGAIIAILIPVSALGFLGLGAVVATHELAEIVVIGNGIRARRALDGPSAHRHRSETALASGAVPSEVAHV
jgi:cation-transporting P-type ATPase G